MRLHHKVLNQVSFNSYKMVTQVADLITLRNNQTLYRQDETSDTVYFILFGSLQVNYRKDGGAVCDVVRGGNVIGEESLFSKKRKFVETVRCCSNESALFRLSAAQLLQMQSLNF